MHSFKPENLYLTEQHNLQISEFYRACEMNEVPTHKPFEHPGDKLEYRAPEDADGAFSFASDMFSVGVTLFEMATGTLPNNPSLDRDQLLAMIDDRRKRALVAFALHTDPSDRPTADELLQKLTTLAPTSMMAGEFRAQVFASMRFNDDGPMAEAKLLRGKLASQGVYLHIIAPKPGESIDRAVFGAMAQCDALLAMATKDVRCSSALRCDLILMSCVCSTAQTRGTLRAPSTKCERGVSSTCRRTSR